MKKFFVIMQLLTLALFAYSSLATRLKDYEKPLIDSNVDLNSTFANSPTAVEYNMHDLW